MRTHVTLKLLICCVALVCCIGVSLGEREEGGPENPSENRRPYSALDRSRPRLSKWHRNLASLGSRGRKPPRMRPNAGEIISTRSRNYGRFSTRNYPRYRGDYQKPKLGDSRRRTAKPFERTTPPQELPEEELVKPQNEEDSQKYSTVTRSMKAPAANKPAAAGNKQPKPEDYDFKGAISYVGGKHMDMWATAAADAVKMGKMPSHGILVDRQDGSGFKFIDEEGFDEDQGDQRK